MALPPPPLSNVYGSRLTTLHHLIFNFLTPSSPHHLSHTRPIPPLPSHAGRTKTPPNSQRSPMRLFTAGNEQVISVSPLHLVRDEDPDDYVSLLHSSFVALSPDAPSIGVVSLDQRWTQEQVVERAIELVSRQKGKFRNVLCFGYRQPFPGSLNKRYRKGPGGLECISPNTAVEILKSQAWRILHSRVGDSLMLYLLTNAAIFYPLPNTCFLQVAGMPLHMTMTSHQERSHSVRGWRSSELQGGYLIRSLERVAMKPSNLPSNKAYNFSVDTLLGSNAVCFGLKNESKLIERRPIFYNSAFSRHAGLPKNHILTKLKPTSDDAILLHIAIFGSHDEGNPSLLKCTGPLKPGVSMHRLEKTKNLNHISNLLQKLISNSRHCQYARLLNRHCPLPTACHFVEGLDNNKHHSILQAKVAKFSTLEEGYATQDEDCIRHGSCKESYRTVDSVNLREQLHCEPTVDVNCWSGFSVAGHESFEDASFVSQTPRLVSNDVNNSIPKEDTAKHVKDSHMGNCQNCKVTEMAKEVHMHCELTGSFLSHSQVVAFIWAVCRRVIPGEFLGSKYNWRMLRKNIFCFVSLRRHETFSLQQCLSKLNISEFPWLIWRERNFPCSSSKGAAYLESLRECKHIVNANAESGNVKCKNLKRKDSRPYRRAEKANAENGYDDLKRACLHPNDPTYQEDPEFTYSQFVWPSIHQESHSHQFSDFTCNPLGEKLENSVITNETVMQDKQGHTHEQASCLPELVSATPSADIKEAVETSCHVYSLPKNCLWPTQHEFAIKKNWLEHWIFWLFKDFIVPLIQAHFYVTESENHRLNVLYYRKSVWAKIKSAALKDILKSQYKRLSVQSVTGILKQRALGVSQVRLLPKKIGVRLIANLRAPSKFVCNVQPSENMLQMAPNMDKNLSEESYVCTNKKGTGKSFSTPMSGKDRKRKRTESIRKYVDKRTDTIRVTDIIPKSFERRNKDVLSFKSVNSVLCDIHHCLKFEQESHPEDLGCSVYDYNEIYYRLLPFITSLKSVPGSVPPLYFVVCDVARAFDTIKQNTLCKVMQKFVREDEYVVARFSSMTSTTGSVKVNHERISISANKCKNLVEFVVRLAAKRANTVFVDQVFLTRLSREQIVKTLDEHIRKNILQMRRGFFLQAVGIPQGSILSSLLCSVYYGHLERQRLSSFLQIGCASREEDFVQSDIHEKSKFPCTVEDVKFVSKIFSAPTYTVQSMMQSLDAALRSKNNLETIFPKQTEKGGCCHESLKKAFNSSERMTIDKRILLRLVDDWLFISTSQDEALKFLTSMNEGFIGYNCFASNHKTAVSFDTVISGNQFKMNVYRTDDGACFMKWSGLLINCNTLEVQADYTRYSGEDIKSTLTVGNRSNEGYFLVTKMYQFMRPKCHPLLYDSNINSPATIRLNAYQAFLLCAMKFHGYYCCVPSISGSSPEFLLKTILRTTRYMQNLLSQRMEKVARDCGFRPQFPFQLEETEWLGLSAFHKVLWKKQSRYTSLLSLIETKLRESKYRKLGAFPYLLYAVDERRSSMFRGIHY